tara:strand:+ start:2168 stop:2368 length:201 start_codon:yes stop_codon:yes gene_type:complete
VRYAQHACLFSPGQVRAHLKISNDLHDFASAAIKLLQPHGTASQKAEADVFRLLLLAALQHMPPDC